MGNRLGQHFLVNKSKIKKIIEVLELKEKDTVIEIGAGHGELTKELINGKELRIIAVEKDGNLEQSLRNSIKNNGNSVEIIHGDALKLLPQLILKLPNYKIVGNIPYYITGRLLRIIGELENKPEIIVLTVQKEVAERITAKPPRMNLLAASVQVWASVEIIDYIPKKDFQPAPQVDSAIIKLRGVAYEEKIMKNYYKLIKILFKQPRKTILNNLANAFLLPKDKLKEKLERAGINAQERPQNLNLEQIKHLSLLLKNE